MRGPWSFLQGLQGPGAACRVVQITSCCAAAAEVQHARPTRDGRAQGRSDCVVTTLSSLNAGPCSDQGLTYDLSWAAAGATQMPARKTVSRDTGRTSRLQRPLIATAARWKRACRVYEVQVGGPWAVSRCLCTEAWARV